MPTYLWQWYVFLAAKQASRIFRPDLIDENFAKFLMSLTVIWSGMNCLDPQVILEVCNGFIGEISHYAAKIREKYQKEVNRLNADELM